jgi:hypothetical protein
LRSLPSAAARRADYFGIGTTTWDQLVEDKLMPKPKLLRSVKVWDRYAIDKAFAALGGDEEPDDPYARVAR